MSGTELSETGGVRERTRAAAKLVLGFALMGVFLWLAFRSISPGEFWHALKSARLFPVLQFIGVQFAAFLLRAWRWRALLSDSGGGLPFIRVFAALTVGYAVNTAVPRGGEIVRVFYLRRLTGASVTVGLGSVVVERLLDLVALLLLFPLAMWFYQEELSRLIPGLGQAAWAALGTTALGLALVWGLGRRPEKTLRLLRAVLRRVWPSREARLAQMGENFLQGLGGLFQKRKAAEVYALSAGIWTLHVFGMWLLFFSFPFGGSLPPGAGAAITVAFIVAVAFLIPSPGGAGTVHYLAAQTLAGLFAVPAAEALAYATVLHASAALVPLVLGGVFGALLRPSRGNDPPPR